MTFVTSLSSYFSYQIIPPVSVSIRQATPADLPELHRLVAELADHLGESADFETTLPQFTQDFHDGFFHALVADDGEKILGMALYCFVYSTWKGRMIYLEDFVINERYRGLGLGQRLWRALKERGRAQGCTVLKWQVVEDDAAALRFYRKQDPILEAQWVNGKVML